MTQLRHKYLQLLQPIFPTHSNFISLSLPFFFYFLFFLLILETTIRFFSDHLEHSMGLITFLLIFILVHFFFSLLSCFFFFFFFHLIPFVCRELTDFPSSFFLFPNRIKFVTPKVDFPFLFLSFQGNQTKYWCCISKKRGPNGHSMC